MGVIKFFSSSSFDKHEIVKTEYSPSPLPRNYRILDYSEDNGNLLLSIQYLDVENFEGKKILLFRDFTYSQIITQKEIDPHFSESKEMKSPFARFEPTLSGWNLALKISKTLSNEEIFMAINKITAYYPNGEGDVEVYQGDFLIRNNKTTFDERSMEFYCSRIKKVIVINRDLLESVTRNLI